MVKHNENLEELPFMGIGRYKSMVFRDFALTSDLSNVYLKFETMDVFTSYFFDNYDQMICDEPGNEIIFKITEVPNTQIPGLLYAFDAMTQEISPITLAFFDNYFEVWEHSGFELEEGWGTDYGMYQYDHYTAYHKELMNAPQNDSIIYNHFKSVASKLDSLTELLTSNYSFVLSPELLNKIAIDKKRMNLCVFEDIPRLKLFLSNYRLFQGKDDVIVITTEIFQLFDKIENAYNSA